MTLIFDSYVADQGKDIPVTENRKNCQLNIDLLYPPGFQYSVFSADYRGYVALDKGPINPHHVLILPIEHRSSSLTLSSAAFGELERYLSALRTCFASKVTHILQSSSWTC